MNKDKNNLMMNELSDDDLDVVSGGTDIKPVKSENLEAIKIKTTSGGSGTSSIRRPKSSLG